MILRNKLSALRLSGRFASLLLVLTLALPGCGDEYEWLDALPSPTRSAVVVASPTELAQQEALPGSYIVTFRAPRGSASRGYRSFLTESVSQHQWLDAQFLTDPRVKDIRYITTVDLANPRPLKSEFDFDPPPGLRLAWDSDKLEELAGAITEVNFTSAEVAPTVLAEWEQAGAIWFAEPNYASTLYGSNDAKGGADGASRQQLQDNPIADSFELPSYKKASSIWWHKKIQLTDALDYASTLPLTTLATPIIAVLDSGIDKSHPGLEGRIWVNPFPGGVGCKDDINGCDTTVAHKGSLGGGGIHPFGTAGHGLACPAADGVRDVCQHGTHVAGIIVGKVDSTIGGVCPVCRVMAIRIIKNVGGRGIALDSAILNGLKYVSMFSDGSGKAGLVRVVNASFGKASRSRAVAVLVSVLRRPPAGVLIVAAAGNEDTMLRAYPAALNDVVAVAATAEDGAKAQYSNFGPWVDVAAPGGDRVSGAEIYSTVPGGDNGPKQGTSMAAPVVAGVAGLILAVDPGRDFASLRRSIVQTANPSIYGTDIRNGLNYNFYFVKPQGENRRMPLLGSGIVDALAAMEGRQLSRGFLASSNKRVDDQCGTIRGRTKSGVLGGILLLIPILMAVIFHGLSRGLSGRQKASLWQG